MSGGTSPLEAGERDERRSHELAAISVRGVRRAFHAGEVVALDGLDLEVRRGEFVAVLGPSGCGKSTLLRLIAGLDAPTGGAVRVAADGVLVDPRENLGKRGRGRIAFVFQDPHLLPWRNVVDNVALPLELKGDGAARDRRARALRALAQVRLDDAAERYPAELSGGMRMRVSIARALVTDPNLLLLDEPFAALDEITRQALDESLRELWLERRMTIVFVTHSIAEAVFLAERAVVLTGRPARVAHDGRIELPTARAAALRGDGTFAREAARLYAALASGAPR